MNPEYSGALQPSGGSKRLITDEDLAYANADKDTFTEALVYVNAVKETFKDRKEKYDQFLKILKDLRDERINIVDTIVRIKELFKGYHTLLLGFKTFVPKGCEFTLPPEEEATNYVNTIKIITSLLKINKVDAISMVKELLKGHHDLLLGFNTFLPKGCEFTLPLEEEAINYVNKIRII